MATVAAPGGERWTDGMDESEKYAFVSSPDGGGGGWWCWGGGGGGRTGGGRLTLSLLPQDLGGYLCLRGLLTADEVQRLNDALDAMTEGDEVQLSESYARESPLMRGAANVLSIVATTVGRPDNAELVEAMEAAGYPSADNSRQNGPMAVEELEGILRALALPGHVRLSDAEVGDILGQVEKTPDGSVRLGSTRRDIGGLLEWPQPYCEPFRELLCHPRLGPVLDTILGRGYRLDHGPSVIEMSKGCDGQILHGGAHERFTNGGFMEGCECSPPTPGCQQKC